MRIVQPRLDGPYRLIGVALTVAAAVGCEPLPSKTADDAAAGGEPAGGEAAAPAQAAPTPEDQAAQEATNRAKEWLALVDQGQYAESWDAAAALFQASTTKEQWTTALEGARGPLGDLSSRQFRAAEYKAAIEGAPEGKYVVVHYDSTFAQKPNAREIVTLRQQDDQSWKVAGYFVQ